MAMSTELIDFFRSSQINNQNYWMLVNCHSTQIQKAYIGLSKVKFKNSLPNKKYRSPNLMPMQITMLKFSNSPHPNDHKKTTNWACSLQAHLLSDTLPTLSQ